MRISDWSSDVCSSDLQRQLGLFLPAVLKMLQLGDVAAHFLLVGDRAGGGGADLDQRLVHLEDDLADHLFRVLRTVEQVGAMGGVYVAGRLKIPHFHTLLPKRGTHGTP